MAKTNPSSSLRIAVAGIAGRMGLSLADSLLNNHECVLSVASLRKGDSRLQEGAEKLLNAKLAEVILTDDLATQTNQFDTLIDFTSPEASLNHLKICLQQHKQLVIGSTGFSAQQQQHINQASKSIAILQAANMSYGVNLCFKLLQMIGQIIHHQDADIEILETHHRYKKDAPSGTALEMGRILAKAKQTELDEIAVYQRQASNCQRQAGTIGFQSLRAGDVIGEHSVTVGLEGERIELSHKADNRNIYARGAIQAAVWLQHKPSGLYSMQDLL